MPRKQLKTNDRQPRRYSKLTQAKYNDILKDLEWSGNLSASCAANGITEGCFHQHLRKYPEKREEVDIAREKACHTLEAEAWRRALEGDEVPVWHQGVQVGTERRKSDRMLEILLKSNMPSRYSNKTTLDVNHSHDLNSEAHQKLQTLLNIEDQTNVIDAEFSESNEADTDQLSSK